MIHPTTFLSSLHTAPLRREGRYDNETLAQWNREQRCAICGAPPRSENSHTVKKGRGGNSASQVYGLPLCPPHHVEYETTNIEDYLSKYPNLFEIVTLNIERWADHFICNDRTPAKKAKVQQPKKDNSIFKKIKNSSVEKCKLCFMKSLPTDQLRHSPDCRGRI